jgi:hypothetical protein
MEWRSTMLALQNRQRLGRRRPCPGEYAFLSASKALADQEREVFAALRVFAVLRVQPPAIKALQVVGVPVLAEWADQRQHVQIREPNVV